MKTLIALFVTLFVASSFAAIPAVTEKTPVSKCVTKDAKGKCPQTPKSVKPTPKKVVKTPVKS